MFDKKVAKKAGRKGQRKLGITLIASNCELAGDIKFTDQIQIDGIVNGNVYALSKIKTRVTVSEMGVIKGEIRAPHVIVNGEVLGDIHATEYLELAAKARVKGNVYYTRIEMVSGAKMDGQLIYSQRDLPIAEGQDDERLARKPDGPGQTMSETAKITPMR